MSEDSLAEDSLSEDSLAGDSLSEDPPSGDSPSLWSRLGSDPRTTIALRDVASLRREKTIVLALVIQLFVAAFSSFLVVGLTSLYDPGAMADGQVDVAVTGNASDSLVEAARETGGTRTYRFPTRAAALDRFHDGAVDAAVEADSVTLEGGGGGSDGGGGGSGGSEGGGSGGGGDGSHIQVEVVAPQGNFETTFVVVQLRRVLTTLERTERVERQASLGFRPLDVPDPVDASPYFGFTYTVLIPLLLFLPPFISGSVAVDVLTEEMERGTLELLRVAPVSLGQVVEGKAIGMILLAPLQAVLWLGLLAVNGIAVSNVVALVVLVAAMATVLSVLGLALGLLTGGRRQAQFLYSVLALLLFGATVALPEHPATTVAKLAVGSATGLTFAHVAGFVALGVLAYAFGRHAVDRVDPERY